MNKSVVRRPARPAFARAAIAIAALLLVLTASCSVVFRSSIQGTVIDSEDWDDGTTTGVTDAKVFLYTDEAARNEDFAAYVDGNEATLPDGAKKADGSAKSDHLYFQSTVTDANGAYDFTGFIWEELFSDYGKTADRKEVFLLTYHPDYGLWRNPVPLYVVSDVTNQLDQIKIEDLWNEGTIAGTVLDWKKANEKLEGVTINFYVAKSWTYDGDGSFANVVYDDVPSASTTSDREGYWSVLVAFPMKPDRTTHALHNNAPVRIAFVLNEYRAHGAGISNVNLVISEDLDSDGKKAEEGDYSDAYIQSELAVKSTTVPLTKISDITMQRYEFHAGLSGRVVQNKTIGLVTIGDGIDGVTVELAIGTETFTTDTAPVDTANTTESGRFDMGTVTWKIDDILTGEADQKTGKIGSVISISGYTFNTDGNIPENYNTTILPDSQRYLTLKVTAITP